MRFETTELAEATDGKVVGPSVSVAGIEIDARVVEAGGVFVAVRAERDGHDFVPQALDRGAALSIVDHELDVAITQLVVADTVSALADIGRAARARTSGKVIGVTGSVGKTSTKDMLAAICHMAGPTTASVKSLNNEMGVPLTLANGDAEAQRIVIEMGARGPGHISYLCDIARPDIGIVTKVASAHTALFGSLEAVAEAKGELIASLPSSGLGILSTEIDSLYSMRTRCAGEVLTFGDGGDVRAVDVRLDDDLRSHFTIESPWGSVTIELGVRGAHNVDNALGAAAAALATGCSLDDVAAGLAAAALSPSRMSLVRLAGGGVVLDDAYNANPASMRAGLEALAALPADRHVAVLGVMGELGSESGAAHQEIADLAGRLGIELLAVGTADYGVEPLADVDAAIGAIPAPTAGVAVLVKGSRVAQLDRLARHWSSEDQQGR